MYLQVETLKDRFVLSEWRRRCINKHGPVVIATRCCRNNVLSCETRGRRPASRLCPSPSQVHFLRQQRVPVSLVQISPRLHQQPAGLLLPGGTGQQHGGTHTHIILPRRDQGKGFPEFGLPGCKSLVSRNVLPETTEEP